MKSNSIEKKKRIFFFDVDETLYEKRFGLIKFMSEKRNKYNKRMEKTVKGFPILTEKEHMDIFIRYGSPTKALYEKYGVEVDHIQFLDEITDGSSDLIAYKEEELKKIHEIFETIEKIEGSELWILSNACITHVDNILKKMKLQKFFMNDKSDLKRKISYKNDRIINANRFLETNIEKYLAKPNKKSYEFAEKVVDFKKERGDEIWFFEDSSSSCKQIIQSFSHWNCVFIKYERKDLIGNNVTSLENIFGIEKLLEEKILKTQSLLKNV